MSATTPTPGTPEGNAATAAPLHDEADIGSGERSPGQHETDELIKQIPPLPPSQPAGGAPAGGAGGGNAGQSSGNSDAGAGTAQR
ncbi:MAG: hypothetical protein ABIT83_13540 [Massilia sp.]